MSSARPARAGGRRIVIGVGGAVGVAAVLAAVLVHRRDEFVTALQTAPAGILVAATGLQLHALIARSAAWWVCLDAAGGTVGRRPLFRAASIGYPGSQLNSELGAAPGSRPCGERHRMPPRASRRVSPAGYTRYRNVYAAEPPVCVHSARQ